MGNLGAFWDHLV
uniref:Uncharacterized protein n=1 Tax=Rhizophora mucronata TaxID=61149 RepID=A0A2P2P825_RHIMU